MKTIGLEMAQPRPFRELLDDVLSDPSRWEVVNSESVPSSNRRNAGGTSLQELLRHRDTGEEVVRHTLFRPDGSLFDPPHYRPAWK
jgi:hypothetical protein